jgi:dihydrofolate synthase / folylpolyglutamate synthase
MTIEQALTRLFALHTFGIKLGLENIEKFLEHIGNPQNHIRTIHVAGSNGKGSTSAFLASILQEMGNKVGLYTSPHFVNYNERIKIDSLEIPDDYVADFISRYYEYIEENKLTFFEVTTAIAFKYFMDNKVDLAVIETGLGGRLDATNVLTPLASVITSISLEHTQILGDTIDKITVEKAGIIKHGIPVFTGQLPPESIKIIEEKCQRENCKFYKLSDYTIKRKDSIELYTEEIELDDFTMPMRGGYQKYNAALAGLVVAKLFNTDDFLHIERGIKNVIKNTGLQGRYEFYNMEPDIIFDSAHNPDGVTNFLSEFRKDLKSYKKKVLLFGVMKDKSIKEMLTELNKYFDEIRISDIAYERAAKTGDLVKLANEIEIKVAVESNPVEFIESFKKNDGDDCLVVLGSMYLLGEIKSKIGQKIA